MLTLNGRLPILAGDDRPKGLIWMGPAKFAIRARGRFGRRAKMSDQERWLNEILDILGLPRDTGHRDYTRELIERSTSVEQIYRSLRSRMDSRLS
jgi:hypothetical protein